MSLHRLLECIDSMKVIRLAPPVPHAEEARSAVSKHGGWRDVVCVRPSRRVQRSQACADCVNLSALHTPQDEDLDVTRTKETHDSSITKTPWRAFQVKSYTSVSFSTL